MLKNVNKAREMIPATKLAEYESAQVKRTTTPCNQCDFARQNLACEIPKKKKIFWQSSQKRALFFRSFLSFLSLSSHESQFLQIGLENYHHSV